jgi:hypothetical protein
MKHAGFVKPNLLTHPWGVAAVEGGVADLRRRRGAGARGGSGRGVDKLAHPYGGGAVVDVYIAIRRLMRAPLAPTQRWSTFSVPAETSLGLPAKEGSVAR